MTEVYLLQNQNGYFLNNQQEWVDGREPNRLYKTSYKDEAINSKVELTVKSAELRIQILECPTNERGIPQIAPELLPEAIPIEPPKADQPEIEKAELEKTGAEQTGPDEPIATETNTKVESGNTSANDSSACESDITANRPNS